MPNLLLDGLDGYYKMEVQPDDPIPNEVAGGVDLGAIIGTVWNNQAGKKDLSLNQGSGGGNRMGILAPSPYHYFDQSFFYNFWAARNSWTAGGASAPMLGVWDSVSGQNFSWVVRWHASQLHIEMSMFLPPTGEIIVIGNTGIPAGGTTYHMISGGFDKVAGLMWMQFNGGTRVTTVYTAGGRDACIAPFSFGWADWITANRMRDGQYDELGLWGRNGTEADVADLWNSGAGLFFDDFESSINPGVHVGAVRVRSALWKRKRFAGSIHNQADSESVSGYVRQTMTTKDESALVAGDQGTFVRYDRNYYTIPPTNFFAQYRIRLDFAAGKTFHREDGFRYYDRLYKDNQSVHIDGPCVVNGSISHSFIHPLEDAANEVMNYVGGVSGIDAFSVRFWWFATYAFTDLEADLELARVENDANNYIALKLVAGDQFEREYNRNDVYGPHSPIARLEKVRGGSIVSTADVRGIYFGNTLTDPSGEAQEDYVQFTLTHHAGSGIYLRVERNGVIGEGTSTGDTTAYDLTGLADIKYTGVGYFGRPELVQQDTANKNVSPTKRIVSTRNMHAVRRIYGQNKAALTSGDDDVMGGQLVRSMIYREVEDFDRIDSAALGAEWGTVKTEVGNGWSIETNKAICEEEGFRYWANNRYPVHKDYQPQGLVTLENDTSIIGFLLRWDQDAISSQDEVYGYGVEVIQNTSTTADLRVVRFYNGSRVILATTALSVYAETTEYLLRATLLGSVITGEITTVADTGFITPLATANATDTVFRKAGRVGIYGETAASGEKVRLDDFQVFPNHDTISL